MLCCYVMLCHVIYIEREENGDWDQHTSRRVSFILTLCADQYGFPYPVISFTQRMRLIETTSNEVDMQIEVKSSQKQCNIALEPYIISYYANNL